MEKTDVPVGNLKLPVKLFFSRQEEGKKGHHTYLSVSEEDIQGIKAEFDLDKCPYTEDKYSDGSVIRVTRLPINNVSKTHFALREILENPTNNQSPLFQNRLIRVRN